MTSIQPTPSPAASQLLSANDIPTDASKAGLFAAQFSELVAALSGLVTGKADKQESKPASDEAHPSVIPHPAIALKTGKAGGNILPERQTPAGSAPEPEQTDQIVADELPQEIVASPSADFLAGLASVLPPAGPLAGPAAPPDLKSSAKPADREAINRQAVLPQGLTGLTQTGASALLVQAATAPVIKPNGAIALPIALEAVLPEPPAQPSPLLALIAPPLPVKISPRYSDEVIVIAAAPEIAGAESAPLPAPAPGITPNMPREVLLAAPLARKVADGNLIASPLPATVPTDVLTALSSAQTAFQPAPSSPSFAPSPAPAAPQEFAALIDRLVEARQAAQSTLAVQTISTAINHAEFGQLSLQFQQDASGLSVTVAGNDPDLARAVQAASAAPQSGMQTDTGASPSRQDNAAQQSPSDQRREQSAQRFPGEATQRGKAASPGTDSDANPQRSGIFA